MKRVEVLFFDDCPHAEQAIRVAREAVARTEGSAVVRLVRIRDEVDAVRQRFLGSPSIRVDGCDVEEAARSRTDFGLQCRVYSMAGRLVGAPPITWIEVALGVDAKKR